MIEFLLAKRGGERPMVSRKDFLAAIRERISSGVWPPGTKLPSTARLAESFDVSESLVNQAMATLIDTGEIVTIPGGARYVPGGLQQEQTGDIDKTTDE